MLVALIAYDKTDASALRAENRAAHLAYLDATATHVSQAGPLLGSDGGMIGSLIILDVPDMPTAVAWSMEDPYAKAGLFENVTLTPWKKVIG